MIFEKEGFMVLCFHAVLSFQGSNNTQIMLYSPPNKRRRLNEINTPIKKFFNIDEFYSLMLIRKETFSPCLQYNYNLGSFSSENTGKKIRLFFFCAYIYMIF